MVDKFIENVQGLIKKFLPDEEFTAALQDALKNTVLDIKERKEKNISPHLLMYGIKDETGERPVAFVGLTTLPPIEERQEAFKTIGEKIANEIDIRLMMLILISEGWTREFSQEERKVLNKDNKKVSDYKDKKECLIAAGITLDLREKTIITLIDRDENQNIILRSTQIENEAENYLLRAFLQGYVKGENKKRQEI